MAHLFHGAKAGFASLYVASAMGLAAVLFADDRGIANSPAVFIAYWLALYGVSIVLFLATGGVRVERRALILAGLCGFAGASALWSQAPLVSLKYGASLLLNVPFCVWMARTYSVRQVLRIVLWTTCAMVAAGLLMSAAGAEIVRYIDVHDRVDLLGFEPLRGLFNHKITAGLYAAFAILLSAMIGSRVARAGIAAVLFFFVLRTGSASGLSLLFIAGALFFVVRTASRLRVPTSRLLATLGATAAIAVVGAVFLGGPILEFLGRDATLTGRTVLWAWGIGAFAQNPILGWGYQAYFESNDAYWNLMSYVQFQNYDVPHFHNAYIQTAVDLGLPALIAYVAMIGLAIAASYRAYGRTHDVSHALLATLMLTVLVAGMFINLFLVYNNFPTLLVFVAYLMGGRVQRMRNSQ